MPYLQQMEIPNMHYDEAAMLTNSVIIIALLGLLMLILIPLYIINGIAYSKIAKKASFESPWIAWVPYGAFFITLKAGGLSPYFLLYFIIGALIPIEWFGLNLLFGIGGLIIVIQMDKALLSAFGKDGDLAFLHLIPVIGSLIVWAMILAIAFDRRYQYRKNPEVVVVDVKTEIPNPLDSPDNK